MKMNLIVYSKDRACQLDLLLRSLIKYTKNPQQMNLVVIYTYSNKQYEVGYVKLIKEIDNINLPIFFINEKATGKSFKNLTLSAIKETIPLTMFLVDDDVFIRSWVLDADLLDKNPELVCISLRMEPNYDYCYPAKVYAPPPTFLVNYIWKWEGLKGDWGYPMSLDGHIFRTSDILPAIGLAEFVNPNSLEEQLAESFCIKSRPLMKCYDKAIVLNIPINKVQTYNNNHAGLKYAYSAMDLNESYLQDWLIDLSFFPYIKNICSPHHEVSLQFIKNKPLNDPLTEEKSIVLIIASFNNKNWYKKNLDSAFSQNYLNYKIIYIDDCSTDGTYDLVKNYVHESNKKNKISIIKNQIRQGPLANHYFAIHSCNDNDIIVILDGDDYLAHENVLSYINKIYTQEHVWLTYGQYKIEPGNQLGQNCRSIPKDIVDKNNFRTMFPFPFSHLRTFYAWLFKKIKKQDLQDKNNNFFMMAGDVAAMFPMVEMAAKHFKFIPEVLYVYNYANPISEHINRKLQHETSLSIRNKPKYYKINNREEEPRYADVYLNSDREELENSKQLCVDNNLFFFSNKTQPSSSIMILAKTPLQNSFKENQQPYIRSHL